MTRNLRNRVLAMALLAACALAQQPKPTTGKIHGIVFIVDEDGGRSVIPSVKVWLTGSTHIEVQSDDEGSRLIQLFQATMPSPQKPREWPERGTSWSKQGPFPKYP
jgi:hypothetical protein